MSTVPAELLESAGLVAFEYQLSGALVLLTRAPKWMQPLIDKGQLVPEASPFLENFLIDARVFWTQENQGRLRSGVWLEPSDKGEQALEATAIQSDERAFLVLEILGGKFNEQKHILQAARDSHLESQKLRQELRDLREQTKTLERAMLELAGRMNLESQIQAEALLQDAKRAVEKSEKMQNQYLAQLAHELRTPLGVILWISDTLENTELGLEQREQLEQLSVAARHLSSVTTDLLDFYKLEAGASQIVRALFDLDELARSVMRDFADTAKAKGIELSVRAPESLPIAADQRQLRQVLHNLVANALKFTDSGGSVIIEAIDAGAHLELRVIDTGIGIASADISKLFIPFGKLENPKYNPNGTGLGLVIASRIVEAHGGNIRVSSAVGLGTTFTVTLPQVMN
ncbi:MAG: sensor histidine kinase [Deinococcales bacterium]